MSALHEHGPERHPFREISSPVPQHNVQPSSAGNSSPAAKALTFGAENLSSPVPQSKLHPASKEKWVVTGKSPAAKAHLRAKMQGDISDGVCKQENFMLAWAHLEMWANSTDARDTPTNMARLEEVETLAKRSALELKDPRERVKAFQLLIIAAYHLTAYSSQEVTEDERWAAGKSVAQIVLRKAVFDMPEVVNALAREGQALVGQFRKASRRQLIGSVVDLSEFVHSLRPLRMNKNHPPLPTRLYPALQSMSKDGSSVVREVNVGHVLSLVGAPPMVDGSVVKAASAAAAAAGLGAAATTGGGPHTGSVTCCKVVKIRGRDECRKNLFLTSGDDGMLAVWTFGPNNNNMAGGAAAASSLSATASEGMAEVVNSLTGAGLVGGASASSLSTTNGNSGTACVRTVPNAHSGPVTALEVWPHRCPPSSPSSAPQQQQRVEEAAALSSSFRVLSASSDWSLHLWDLSTSSIPSSSSSAQARLKPLGKLAGHKGPVSCCAVLGNSLPRPDGQQQQQLRCVSGSADGSLKAWNLEEVLYGGVGDNALFGCVETAIEAHRGGVSCMAMFDNGSKALTGGVDGHLKVWDLSKLLLRADDDDEEEEEGGDGADDEKEAEGKEWDLSSVLRRSRDDGSCDEGDADLAEKEKDMLPSTGKAVKKNTAGGGGGGESTKLMMKTLHELGGHVGGVNCVKIFTVGASSSLSSPSLPTRSSSSVPQVRALTGGVDETLKVWSLQGALVHHQQQHYGGGGSGGSSGGGGGSDDGCCVLLRVLDGCMGSVWDCAVFGKGSRAASTSDDTCLRVWDLDSGAVLHSVPGHPHRDYCLDVIDSNSSNGGGGGSGGGDGGGGGKGEQLVSGGDDSVGGKVKVWHVPSSGSMTFEFSLGPSSIPPLLEALSPKPKKKGSQKPVDEAGDESEEEVEGGEGTTDGTDSRGGQEKKANDENWEESSAALNMMNVY